MFFAKIAKDDILLGKEVSSNEPLMNPLNVYEFVDDKKMFELFGRVVMFPLWKNMILVRLQNSADKFDMDAPELTIDMNMMAVSLWNSTNPQSKQKVDKYVKEVSLTANMAQDEVVKRREGMKWKGQDDDHILEMLAKDEKMRAVYEITHDEDDLSAITLVP